MKQLQFITKFKPFVLGFSVLLLGVTGSFAFSGLQPQSASAMSGASVCGSGYSLIYAHQLYNWDVGRYGNARLEVYQNTGTKKICNLTMSTGSWYGMRKYMTSNIGYSGKTVDSSAGYYSYYAGPNYASYTNESTFIVNNGSTTVSGVKYTWNAQAPISTLKSWY